MTRNVTCPERGDYADNSSRTPAISKVSPGCSGAPSGPTGGAVDLGRDRAFDRNQPKAVRDLAHDGDLDADAAHGQFLRRKRHGTPKACPRQHPHRGYRAGGRVRRCWRDGCCHDGLGAGHRFRALRARRRRCGAGGCRTWQANPKCCRRTVAGPRPGDGAFERLPERLCRRRVIAPGRRDVAFEVRQQRRAARGRLGATDRRRDRNLRQRARRFHLFVEPAQLVADEIRRQRVDLRVVVGHVCQPLAADVDLGRDRSGSAWRWPCR